MYNIKPEVASFAFLVVKQEKIMCSFYSNKVASFYEAYTEKNGKNNKFTITGKTKLLPQIVTYMLTIRT